MTPLNPMNAPAWGALREQLDERIGEATKRDAGPFWWFALEACRQKIDRLADAADRGAPIFWYHYGMTPEIFSGLADAEYLPVEFYPFLQVLLGNKDELLRCIEAAEQTGVSRDLCSLLKASLGAVTRGLYPAPALLLNTPTPCASQSGFFSLLSRITGAERAVIDVTERRTPTDLQYMGSTVREAIVEMERAARQAYDWPRLKAALQEAERSLHLLADWGQLRQSRRCTQPAAMMAAISPLMVLFRGEAVGTRIAAAARDDARSTGCLPADDPPPRTHAIWFGKPFGGEAGFYHRIADELALQIMMGSTAYTPPEAASLPAEGGDLVAQLTQRLIDTNPITRTSRRPLADTLDSFRQLCEGYRPDFGILALNRGCKHDLLWSGAVRAEAHQLGLPVYVFEFDMLDSRIKPEQSIRHELDNFMQDMTQHQPTATGRRPAAITAGVDIGSTTSKAALWRGDELLAWHISPSTINPAQTAEDCYRRVLEQAGLAAGDVAYIVGTGYGRAKVPFADENVSEISCHGRGAQAVLPSVRTILDIGGQDTKAIAIAADGRLKDFAMNDKCAAGTGRFLEVTCRSLGIGLPELEALHFQHNGGEPAPLSNVCSVFLESEIINLINDGYSLPAIVFSLHQVVARKAIAQGKRVGLEQDVIVSGGVAKNRGVIDAIERVLGYATLQLPDGIDPQMIGAIGAAVIAQERAAERC